MRSTFALRATVDNLRVRSKLAGLPTVLAYESGERRLEGGIEKRVRLRPLRGLRRDRLRKQFARDLARATRLSQRAVPSLDEARPKGERSLAERVGFEPTVEFPLHTLSKRARSTTPTSLRLKSMTCEQSETV
jgi:hypothetical protein